MDKDARNAIERATQRARRLLEDDFEAQLQGDFDVHRSGMVSAKAGSHLLGRQPFRRDKIVAAIEHKRAAGMGAPEAVVDYLRDAAFTTLNRFVALKMLEARGFVRECITRGEQSSGYREFCGMAPGIALLPDSAGYRLYIESLFDDLSTEVKVLFDRHDPASVLWPKRATFDLLLGVLNAAELSEVWVEDETIGWVYQFFNGADERKKMRDESQAPRTSRELAIRNQFFTPRYVVQYLTDNTLGRIWYEMRGTSTALAKRCVYMLRRLDEGFAPRVKKDPRDIRILDPACGSGHFLLYAFDLLLTIYEEAYCDAESPVSDTTGRSLAADYASLDLLRQAVPGLILAHNLHGVDIDPRCAQIAQLALWMRAQRALSAWNIRTTESIRRVNIVVAEPMPGEAAFRREFTSGLDEKLGQLVEHVFGRMQVAGEAGSLLRIEQDIRSSIREIYGEHGALFQELDEETWRRSERELTSALSQYAERMSITESYQRKLFADNAARGFAFIDIFRQRYDVVLMNPPFGEFFDRLFAFLKKEYPLSKRDLAIVFVDRGRELLCDGGRVGALHSRKLFFIDTQSPWRRDLLQTSTIAPAADLGHRVLDGALVEVAASVIAPGTSAYLFIDCLNAADKASVLREVAASTDAHPAVFRRQSNDFLALPGAQFAYRASSELLQLFSRCESLEPTVALCRDGLSTGDNSRFTRLFWECSRDWRLSRVWVRLAKGGEYKPYFLDNELLIKWSGGYGEMAAFNLGLGNEARSRRGSKNYFRPALTYTGRTASALSVRILPANTAFSDSGPAVLPENFDTLPAVLGFMNSRTFSALHELCLGGGDSVSSGSAARDFTSGALGKMPVPSLHSLKNSHWPVAELVELFIEADKERETSSIFCGIEIAATHTSVANLARSRIDTAEDRLLKALRLSQEVEEAARLAYGLSESASAAIAEIVGPHPATYPEDPARITDDFEELFCMSDDALVDRVAARLGSPRHITVKSFVVDRRYELLAHYYAVHPSTLCAHRAANSLLPRAQLLETALMVVSFAVGIAFGRWHKSASSPPSHQMLVTVGLPDQPPALSSGATIPFAVEDEGDPRSLLHSVEESLSEMFTDGKGVLAELGTILIDDPDGLDRWLSTEFFGRHLQAYSMHRRRAPIYWQLATGRLAYAVWVYYPALKRDSLYQLLHDVVEPKIAFEQRRCEEERQLVGASSVAKLRKELAARESLLDELRDFRDELARIAPLWNPDHNDGAIINFAPLWRLVPQHKAWQKELKETWDALCDEKCEWTHLAMHVWPERVVPKCAIDRSLAIAHGLQDVFWVEGDDGKWNVRNVPLHSIDELVRERTSSAVKAALKSLLETTQAASNGGRTGRRRATASEGKRGSR